MSNKAAPKKAKREKPLSVKNGAATCAEGSQRRHDSPTCLEDQLRFETLVSELSARFVTIAPDQVDGEIEHALEQILEFFQVDRCGLLGLSSDRTRVHLTHAAYAEAIERVSGDIDLATLFPWVYERLVLQGLPVDIAGIEDLPEKAGQDRASCTAMGIRSFLDIPLFFEGRVSSIIVINAMRRHRFWPAEYIPRLRLLGEIFLNALERKRSDQALRESEMRLQLATDSAGAGLWSMDVSTSRVWVTAKTRELFCFSPEEEITYGSFDERIHPEDRGRVREVVQLALQTGAELHVEYRIVCPDGSLRWIAVRGSPKYSVSGNVERLMGASVDITERKQMQDQLRTAAEEWHKTFNAIQDMIMIMDREFRIVQVNDAGMKFFGLPKEKIIGAPCYTLMHGTESPIDGCPYKQMMDTRCHEETEVYDPERDMWFHVVVDPLLDEMGDIIGVVHTVKDITDRKRAETALEESRTQIAAVMNSTKDFIWSVDPERFGLLTWNRAFWDYFFEQRGIELATGMTPAELVPPDYVPLWHGLFSRALREELVVTEYVVVAQTITLLLSLQVMKKGDQVFGISVFGKDITERKRAEQELRQSEERFRQVAESVGDFIWEVDANGLYRYTSPAVVKILGYTPEELIGKMHFYDLFAPEVREELKAAAFKVFVAKNSFRAFPNANMSKDGKIVHLETSGVPVLDEAGNLVGYRGSDTDITERKQAEEALRESEAALRNSQKDLRRLAGRLISAQEEELSRLSRELHDDLTQRLAVLAIEAGKLELDLGKIPEACPEIQQKISQMKEQLIRVSEEVHRISRQLHPTILDDLGLVRAIESECAALMSRHNVRIIFRREDVPDVISGDISLCLYRVVQEGLKNVTTHSRSESCEIFLKRADDGLCLMVKDGGVGFDPLEVRQKPGLGLASMRERIRLAHGDFSVSSQPGEGTVISVWVPLSGGGE